MASRGYGITQQDMDASRLVFVSVPTAKPRRKVAVPVPDDYTWQDFLQQVQQKLKLTSIESVSLASSGEQIRSLDDLQDIDELHVVEGRSQTTTAATSSTAHPPGNGHAGPIGNGHAGSSTQAQSARTDSGAGASTSQPSSSAATPLRPSRAPLPAPPLAQPALSDRHRQANADADPGGLDNSPDAEPDEDKYVKRTGSVKRSLQKVMPNMFQPSLPVTTRDVKGGKASTSGTQPARRRRRRQQIFSLRNILVLFALLGTLGTMLFLYSKVQPNAPK